MRSPGLLLNSCLRAVDPLATERSPGSEYTSEADIDTRAAQTEEHLFNTNMSLNNDLFKEVSELKKRRPQVSMKRRQFMHYMGTG